MVKYLVRLFLNNEYKYTLHCDDVNSLEVVMKEYSDKGYTYKIICYCPRNDEHDFVESEV